MELTGAFSIGDPLFERCLHFGLPFVGVALILHLLEVHLAQGEQDVSRIIARFTHRTTMDAHGFTLQPTLSDYTA